MNVKINADAFKGLTHFNGLTAKQEFDKKTEKPVVGKTGMRAFTPTSGDVSGRIFLASGKFTVIASGKFTAIN